MGHHDPAFAVCSDAVRSSTTAQLNEIQYAGKTSIGEYWNLYYLIRTRQGHVEGATGWIECNSVWAWQLVEQEVQPAVRTQAEDPSGGIDEIGHSLISEIKISVPRENQIVGSLERLQIVSFYKVVYPLGRRFDHDDPVPPIGHE